MVTSPDGTTSISDYCQLLSGGATSTLNGGTAASGVDPGETTQGELRQVTLIWETGSSPSGLGDPLFVRFFCDGTVGGGDRAFWDDVELTVEPLGSFSSWIANFAGLGGQTGIDDDPDGDGNDNGVENYFGTNPGEFSGGIVAGVVDKGANTFTFTHPLNDTPASDLTVTYRWSTDLVNFHDDEATNGGGTTTVDFSDPVPAGDTFSVTASISGTVIPDKLFVVIEVTQN